MLRFLKGRKMTKISESMLILAVSWLSLAADAEPSNKIKQRLRGYFKTNTELELMSDERISSLVNNSGSLGVGIGGLKSQITVGSTQIFVKRIPLTNMEREFANMRSTANVFHLPLYYQYGVGSRGFGAWRELAAHIKTTNWVLFEENTNFPLLYHWRVIPKTPQHKPNPKEKEETDKYVQYWGSSKEIRKKEEATLEASMELLLFIEYIPTTLWKWLESGWRETKKLEHFEEQIVSTISFMNQNGLYHFDSHFHNILTDGETLYFSDLGLASDLEFSLSKEEKQFLEHHKNYDLARSMLDFCVGMYRSMSLASGKADKIERSTVRQFLRDSKNMSLPPTVSSMVRRWGPTALIMDDFFDSLAGDNSKSAPYPENEIGKAVSTALKHKSEHANDL